MPVIEIEASLLAAVPAVLQVACVTTGAVGEVGFGVTVTVTFKPVDLQAASFTQAT